MTDYMADYDLHTPVTVPVEIRLADQSVYIGSLTDHGTICHRLATRSGQAESMGNVQSHNACPQKAVPGWQAEMVAYFGAGIRTIVEIR